MFSLEAPKNRRRHGPLALASLTESLQMQQPAWRNSSTPVAVPRITAKRIPSRPLKVTNPSPQAIGAPAFLLTQRDKATQNAAGLREGVNSFVLFISTALNSKISAVRTDLKARRGISKQRRQQHEGFKMPWRRKGSSKDAKPSSSSSHSAACKEAIDRGLAAEHAMDMREAVRCFQEVTKQLPRNAHYRSMLAKQWTDCTYLDVSPAQEKLNDDSRRHFNTTAMEHAKEAIALDGSLALPHIAACTSMGRLALLSDNKTKVRLAHDARQEAVTALALEPSNDLAHHLMGRWHYEMANLNVVVRTLVRVMYGTALAPGSHHDALESYQKAVSLAPSRLIHRVELGRTLDRLGKKEQARQELEAALDMDVEDINAHLQRQDAIALLKRMPKRRPSAALPSAETQHSTNANDNVDSGTAAGVA